MTVTAVDRCLSLMEALAGEPEGLELSALAAHLGLPQSATHRILSTLVRRGWAVQDRITRRYALSLKFGMLAFRDLDARVAPDLVQSVLDRLARRTREYCRLALVEGESLVWVARAQGAPPGLRYEPEMGQEIVLHATANGKAWLSTLPESEALRIVCARGFTADRPLGPKAVTDVDRLRAHLREARRRGYATAIEEAEAGTAAIAVPFRASVEAEAPVVGTISVAGPCLRIRPERFASLATELMATARELASVWPLHRRQRTTTERKAPAAAAATATPP